MAGLRIVITPQFCVSTELLHLSFRLADVEQATVLRSAGTVQITLPLGKWSGALSPRQKAWLHSVVAEELRLCARRYLPQRLAELASRHGVAVEGVTIKNIATRWGSCSSRRHINLSLWLMLAPPHLIDYVLLHELCHLSEMNHGPRFWALLDSYTTGRARQLDREMHKFEKELLQNKL